MFFKLFHYRFLRFFFHRLRFALIQYIWAAFSSQLKYEVLILPEELGGVGLPHLEWYYQAAHPARLIDYYHNTSHKLWTKLEFVVSSLSPYVFTMGYSRKKEIV